MQVLFLPNIVGPTTTIRGIFERLGWAVTYNIYGEFDFVISWGDFYQKRRNPGYRAPDILTYLKASGYWILNEHAHNSNKDFVEECHVKAFGYSAGIDPLTWQGPLVEKSNANYAKDSQIRIGPLSPKAVKPGKYYMKLINDFTEGLHLNHRTHIVDGTPTWVQNYYVKPETRFLDRPNRCQTYLPSEAYSAYEIEQIELFIRLYGIDYGECDILRDGDDGRLYVVDANPMPGAYGSLFGSSQWINQMVGPEFRQDCINMREDVMAFLVEPFQAMVERHLLERER